MTSATGKDKYYWTELRGAITAGRWSAQHPAKALKGAVLSWPELFRKFNKHCRGFQDVTEVVSQTRSLAVLLCARSKDEDQDDPPKPGQSELDLGDECLLSDDQHDAADDGGYQILKNLESANFDTLNFALAYWAYALGRPEECLAQLSKVPHVSHVQSHIPVIPASTRSSLLALQAPSADSSISSASGSFVSTSTISVDEIKDGRAWAMTEAFRSICLQGMSHEKLSPTSLPTALKAYAAALPLLTIFESEVVTLVSTFPPATTPGKPDFTCFSRFRELWRWVERLIWRAVVLCARGCDLRDGHNIASGDTTHGPPSHSAITTDQQADLAFDNIWVWFKHYMACSIYWPPTFRTNHRCTVLSLHLCALVRVHQSHTLTSREDSPESSRSSQVSQPKPFSELNKPPAWLQKARSVVHEYRAILNVCTQFPRAGERNDKVENFVDLCVAVWEASGAVGEYAGWVIDVLWWATRLTFNSLRIYRHMTRLFYASGDTQLAKRTLRLYVQIAGKAYQTLMSDASVATQFTQMTIGKTTDDKPWVPDTRITASPDADTDRHWVQTLTQGARMLCRTAGSGKEGAMEDIKEAGVLIEKAKTRLNSEESDLVAAVALVEGIWRAMLALKEDDPLTRSRNFELAHEHFLSSFATCPTSSCAYHLALSFARPGSLQDLQQALIYAGQAMEGEPGEIRYWHLMSLLLASVENWTAALEILDRGADIGEATQHGEDQDDEETETGRSVTETGTVRNECDNHTHLEDVQVRDFVVGNGNAKSSGSVNGHFIDAPPGDSSNPHPTLKQNGRLGSQPDSLHLPLLANNATSIPPASTLLCPALDHPKPSTHEKFEYALQLRMTQVAVTEYVEGAESAGDKWVEVFAWVAERRGIVAQQRRASMDGGQPPASPIPNLPPQPVYDSHINGQLSPLTSTSVELPLPIPITVSPATPDAQFRQFSLEHQNAVGSENGSLPHPNDGENGKAVEEHHHHAPHLHLPKRSNSIGRDTSKSKKVQRMLKNRVHKGQVTITTISKRIGNGVVRNGPLRRSNSTPDFHAVLRPLTYQASSIHSRKRISSITHSSDTRSTNDSPPPPPPLPDAHQTVRLNNRAKKENRLLSDLWLMSAATFRRLGKIEQAKGAIQEAEVRDEENPGVWVQLGLYYTALGHRRHAIDAFRKALFISPDDIPASVHLCRLYLMPNSNANHSPTSQSSSELDTDFVDLAAGILCDLTRGPGWDVPEAWYFLAKAYELQGRKERERECLKVALSLSEQRGIRDIGSALGWCI